VAGILFFSLLVATLAVLVSSYTLNQALEAQNTLVASRLDVMESRLDNKIGSIDYTAPTPYDDTQLRNYLRDELHDIRGELRTEITLLRQAPRDEGDWSGFDSKLDSLEAKIDARLYQIEKSIDDPNKNQKELLEYLKKELEDLDDDIDDDIDDLEDENDEINDKLDNLLVYITQGGY
jgi:chromosome segregation ATPase